MRVLRGNLSKHSFITQTHIKHCTDESDNMDLRCLALTSVLMVELLAAQRGM